MLFRRVRAEFSDGVIDLLPLRLYPPEKEMGFGRVYDYMIVPHGTHREVGRISLRMGKAPVCTISGISAIMLTRRIAAITTRAAPVRSCVR